MPADHTAMTTPCLPRCAADAKATRKGVRDWMKNFNLPSGAVSVFNEPDLLDDLLDHWTSSDHVQERQMLVRRLQVIVGGF